MVRPQTWVQRTRDTGSERPGSSPIWCRRAVCFRNWLPYIPCDSGIRVLSGKIRIDDLKILQYYRETTILMFIIISVHTHTQRQKQDVSPEVTLDTRSSSCRFRNVSDYTIMD
ncbi:hypothetical protein RRG08_042343 [Elysia crispata]|uniref:Uncharacterized protein n=1 Tax=Elysia crispata TaxID=231223 RepID=A0AAE1AJ85_9GAST|nr:hypothetical protein RRG08_042343 [Elysia crispata]